MKPSSHHSTTRAILAGSLVFAGALDATTLFTEDFEGDTSKWDDEAVWGAYNTAEDFSGSDHSQIPGGGNTYANLIQGTGASINGGPATATINVTGLTEEESTALGEGKAFWSFEAWLASYTANEEYTVFSAEWFDGPDGSGNSLGTSTFADGSSDVGVTQSVEGFEPPSSTTLGRSKTGRIIAKVASSRPELPAWCSAMLEKGAGTEMMAMPTSSSSISSRVSQAPLMVSGPATWAWMVPPDTKPALETIQMATVSPTVLSGFSEATPSRPTTMPRFD